MSTSIDQAFIVQYEAEVHDVFQRQGGILRVTVRTKDNVQGKTTTFQKAGKGVATEKARHGRITPMNQDHTPIPCNLSDFYAGDWVDLLDEAKTNIDERMVIARGGAWALGRKSDDQILTALDGTTQTGATITLTNTQTVENSFLDWVGALDDNDAPNDGSRVGVITPKAHRFLMKIDEYKSADYVTFGEDMPAMKGAPIRRFRHWNGVNWTVHTGISGVKTAAAKCFAYHPDAVGYATGAHSQNKAVDQGNMVAADITWHGDYASHWVNHFMSGGACLIDDTGVIEAQFDDTAPLPTA